MKGPVLRVNMIHSSAPYLILTPSHTLRRKFCDMERVSSPKKRKIYFGENLGDLVKGRTPKKLKSLIEVPNVVHVKVHVLSFNMILISSP